eukprot:evm.model.scf_2578EXC.1 EVM.evm.TU.scf_2578EXC.1   scf_2578EXC:9050-11863(+)
MGLMNWARSRSRRDLRDFQSGTEPGSGRPPRGQCRALTVDDARRGASRQGTPASMHECASEHRKEGVRGGHDSISGDGTASFSVSSRIPGGARCGLQPYGAARRHASAADGALGPGSHHIDEVDLGQSGRGLEQLTHGAPNFSTPPVFRRDLISLVHRLQDTFASLPDGSCPEPIHLPQVAVVGGQSSGKSSVLESLVGRDFLPRNKEICTRRPLILQLSRPCPQRQDHGEWAEFLHIPGERFKDFAAVRNEIVEETVRDIGASMWQVSSKPIHLKIHSPHVLPMTLIDLPGISRVPIGDQPSDIEEVLTAITMKYVKQDSCIILAVTAANSDIANSDALKIAQKADPDGHRTLGVLTKLDIMDEGTDVRDYLNGQKEPKLKLGYVGTVNRSQSAVEHGKSVAQALEEEEEWFSANRKAIAYRDIRHQCCGTKLLAKHLNRLLVDDMRSRLPSLRASVRAQLRKDEAMLDETGHDTFKSVDAQAETVTKVLAAFGREFQGIISGDVGEPLDHLYGGARILNRLRLFKDEMSSTLDDCVSYSDEELYHTIQNVYGVEGHVLTAEKAFRRLVPATVRSLEVPCIQCAQAIFEELQGMLDDALSRTDALQRFPDFKSRLRDVSDAYLHDAMKPTIEMIRNILKMEEGYINTDHPLFLGGEKAAEKAAELVRTRDGADEVEPSKSFWRYLGSGRAKARDENTALEGNMVRLRMSVADIYPVEITRVLLDSYGHVVCLNLQDSIPKTILYFLVNSVRHAGLSQVLSRELNRPELYEDLLVEHQGVELRRKELKSKILACKKALGILDDVHSEFGRFG